jgi:hypothetical protein
MGGDAGLSLTLTLLVSGIVANHKHAAAATNYLAVLADPLHARSHFHGLTLLRISNAFDTERASISKPANQGKTRF